MAAWQFAVSVVVLILSIAAGVALLMIVWAMYFAPTLAARQRNHHNQHAIFILNLLLGWTLVGWVIAMVWANIVPLPPPSQRFPVPGPPAPPCPGCSTPRNAGAYCIHCGARYPA